MSKDLANLLAILRRVRQSSCGTCWALPGRRCWRMVPAWRTVSGLVGPDAGTCTSRHQSQVHPSRVLRAYQKGILAMDLDPAWLERCARAEEDRIARRAG